MSEPAADPNEGHPPVLSGMAALAADFDGYIIDLWGVLHDGVRAYPHGLDCLARLSAGGKRILILSNAPRRADEVARHCANMGLTPDTYDVLMSSGEDVWRHLAERSDPWYRALGDRCYHLGPERDLGMREGLDYRFVDDLDEASFILNTGALGQGDSRETYRDFLEAALARKLPMICANPDYLVMRGSAMEICAGTIAHAYEEMGGEVRYHGKPYPGIYETCLDLFAGIAPDRILAVGDSIRTDVVGAQAMGLQAVFVVSGLHNDKLVNPATGRLGGDRLAALCRAEGGVPLAVLPEFRW
jgi:HAD superfamily hydrolase (TIGR01459 family)